MAAFGANNQSRIFPAKLEIKDPDALRSAIAWHARTDGTLLSQCVRALRRQHGVYENLARKDEPFRRELPEGLVAETLSYLDLAEIGAAARTLAAGSAPAARPPGIRAAAAASAARARSWGDSRSCAPF